MQEIEPSEKQSTTLGLPAKATEPQTLSSAVWI